MRAEHRGRAARLAVLSALVAVAGCHRPRTSVASKGPLRGGTLVYATDREPICLDPHVAGDMPQVFVAEQYLDRLVSMDRDGHIRPWLASSWDISPDGRSYTFHLRHDVSFTDGTPLTAEAVRANLDQMRDPHTQSTTAGGYIRQYVGTDVLDAHTAVVHLSRPYAAFLEVLAQGFLGIESPRALARSRDDNCQSPVGSGPFRIVRWDHQSDIVFARNPDYHRAPPTARHQGPAYLDGIVWKFIPEPQVRFASLQAGELDVIDNLPPEDELPAAKNPELRLLVADRPGNPTHGMLDTRRAPFNDIRVREAFVCSADIDGALSSVFFGRYRRAGGPLSPTTPFYSPDFEHAKDYDPLRADRLLDEAGWRRGPDGIRERHGVRLVVEIPERASLAPADRTLWEQVQATARQTGFDVRLEPMSDTQANQRVADWDDDVALGYWNTNTADVLRIVFGSAFLGRTGIGGHHQNNSGFSDPAYDRIMEAALETRDAARRRVLYHQAQAIISSRYLQITTYPQTTRLAIRSDVHGVRIEPSLGVTSLYDAWLSR